MATVQRIDQVRLQQVTEERQVAETRQRLSLFNANTFERTGALQFGDGTRIDVPSMNEQDRDRAAQIFASVPEGQRAAVQASFEALAAAIYNEAKQNPEGIKVGSFSSGLTSALGNSTEMFMLTTGPAQADAAVTGVMFGAMVGVEQELGNFAQDLKNKLNTAKDVRTDITELRNELADWTDPNEKRHFTWTEVSIDANGNVTTTQKEGDLNKAEAEALMKKLEEQLASLSDVTELQKFDLQRMNQDYQQGLNTLSGLLKAQHDMMMAIIRNVKAS